MEPVIRSIGRYIMKNSVNPPINPTEDEGKNIPSIKRGLFVGKMDGTKNDFSFPGVTIRGFPTILIFKLVFYLYLY